MSVDTEFRSFGKIARLSRDIIITEKIDGTNAQIHIDETGAVIRVGSRNHWITPADDNYGFATWVMENRDELLKLGPGRHFGEWWGAGIQRRYGLTEKRFSLFNVGRWYDPKMYNTSGLTFHTLPIHYIPFLDADPCPSCCTVVPVLYNGKFDTARVDGVLETLRGGSVAAPGFKDPEGIIIYHTASGHYYKKTIKDDEKGKAQ